MVAGLGDDDEPDTTVTAADPAVYSPGRSHPVPITRIPQLAAAARARGQSGRVIWVDLPDPPVIHTRGRVPNQWLLSGEFAALPIACPYCGWYRDGACACAPELSARSFQLEIG
ncbi:hypothetical protein JK358_38165 [Nocardia sp. 2]|uniref:Uncharacterized protein n=1 Tax=Nocardia acididurans TaxID=2802282 RepID=A0ABS1MHY8_9NOCA|nr:hypothetical protein [Nocardia acididurans]MBL1080237.1 hypothetical protein [Nocardia acididurans]